MIDLRVTLVDPVTDTVSGVGAPNTLTPVGIWTGEEDAVSEVMSDATGAWTADFSAVYDVQWNTSVNVEQYDDDGDNTWIDYSPSMPVFRMDLARSGFDPAASGVTNGSLTLRSPVTSTTRAPLQRPTSAPARRPTSGATSTCRSPRTTTTPSPETRSRSRTASAPRRPWSAPSR